MKKPLRIYSLWLLAGFTLFGSIGAGGALHAQVINTIAGTGIAGLSGDGGAATAAQIHNPASVAIDGSGNVYIADDFNNRIRKITAATGIISTIAGTGTPGFSGDSGAATAAQLNYPSGVAVDGFGNVYIADNANARIRKVTAATGIISTIAGVETKGFSGDGGAAMAAQLNDPFDVAVDGLGNVYIADANNHRIRKITAATGFISTIAGMAGAGFSGDGVAATAALLYYPTGVAVDNSANVYIADFSNGRIRKITAATGIISTIAGTGTAGFNGDSMAATAAQLYYATGVAVDGSRNVYIADGGNHRIRKIGVVSTAVQSITAAAIVAVYPNPTTGVFVLTIPEVRADATVLVTDVAGKTIAAQTLKKGELPTATFDLSGIAKGMYLVQVRDRALNYKTKIVVQ